MSHRPKHKKIRALLFDLGKVLLHFNFEPAFRRLSRASEFSPKEIEDYFVSSGLEVFFDGGKISSLQFYEQVKKALSHRLDYASFKRVWNEIFTPNKPVIRLVERLADRYRLVLISNTNAMHFDHIRSRYPVIRRFDRLILSYKEKMRKPDERIYRKAMRLCEASPEEIFYIDDRADLTEAADDLGFHTFTYRNNPAELRRAMKALGIL